MAKPAGIVKLKRIWRAESPRNSEPDRATLSIAQGVSPGYGVVIRLEPRQLAGWQIRMSVPFMLSIDYLHINAHPYLPPTRSARGSVTIFTLPQGMGLRVSLRSLATPSQVRPGLY